MGNNLFSASNTIQFCSFDSAFDRSIIIQLQTYSTQDINVIFYYSLIYKYVLQKLVSQLWPRQAWRVKIRPTQKWNVLVIKLSDCKMKTEGGIYVFIWTWNI